ncbi:putative secreted protein [Streptomyces davaonensis JCM 4913]|uniref:Putative secreted protein n=1 Tax=Streptomyces davaonensis (strain DSM 101723 / JCM 4913 / KCC S-0913 / 768) TaxID=1214101 RepID=K4R836_STRDJ|nr:putative secreted protein [Streptomyces davaonensis JCM 4913]
MRVLAGGSLRCASFAASTSPVSASATTHDSAETRGTRGAPARGRTCVPERPSSDGNGPAAARARSGPPDSAPPSPATAAGPSASSPATQSTQVDTATREENLIVI